MAQWQVVPSCSNNKMKPRSDQTVPHLSEVESCRARILAQVSVPEEWVPSQAHMVEVVQVNPLQDEFQGVLAYLRETLPAVTLVKLERIQNLWLWERYMHCKEKMLLKSAAAATEIQLFHGTRLRKPEEIYRSEYGFDFRWSSVTALWGTGSYFAASARYCTDYSYHVPSSNEQQLLLAKVLVGESCPWPRDKSLRRPPPKPQSEVQGLFCW